MLAVTAPSASAAEVAVVDAAGGFDLVGRGWGHGRGMNQWGAQGAALQGRTARQILDFYYPGSSLDAVPRGPVRVKITEEDADLVTWGSADLRVTDQATGVVISWAGLGPQARVVRAADGFLRLQSLSGATWVDVGNPAWPENRVSGPVVLSGRETNWLVLPGGLQREYRGTMTAHLTGSGLDVINTLPSEQYLYGVVPRESPSFFGAAALQAQAVAARSYSRSNCSGGATHYDMLNTTACQVYNGRTLVSGGTTTPMETPQGTAAVDATRDLVLRRSGAVLRTEFSASNGGWTVDSNGWPAQADPWDGVDSRNTNHRWTGRVSAAQVAAAWPQVGTVRSMEVLSRTGQGEFGGRVLSLRVSGTAGVVTATGEQVRSRLGLKSTWFAFGATVTGAGNFERATGGYQKVDVGGWALRVGDRDPRTVTVSVEGVDRGTLRADVARPDVQSIYPFNSASHGFAGAVGTPAGVVQVCARVQEPALTLALGCRAAAVLGPSPIGALDAVSTGFGQVTVSGWTADGDSTGPVDVHVYADGVGVGTGVADRPRPDLAALLPGRAPGYSFTLPLRGGGGPREICAFGISSGTSGDNVLLGCSRVVVDGTPRGSFEAATTSGGLIDVSGWLVDPDSPVSSVHVYVDDVGVALPTSTTRPDVAAAYPAFASYSHGWSGRIAAGPGSHQVCAYGINAGNGSTLVMGCRSVTVRTGSPFGVLERAAAVGGTVEVSGWVVDPETPVGTVHVYVDGVGRAVPTAGIRPDVAAVFPDYASYAHSWSTSVPATAGVHEVCVYGINTGVGSTLVLGCRSVTVRSGPPIGSFEAATGAPGGVDVSGWLLDPDAFVGTVHVYVDAAGTALTTSTVRPDVAAAFPLFKGWRHGWAGRLAATPGPHRVCAYGIDTGGTATLVMGCRMVTVPG